MIQHRVLYCDCAYAQVVPGEVKRAVLQRLCDSGVSFDAVSDLCEMSARKDPALAGLATSGPVKIAACFPRAVKWLFASADAPLAPESTEILNMRVLSAQEVGDAMLDPLLRANLPKGKASSDDAPPDSQPATAPLAN